MLTGTLEGWKKWMLMSETEQKNFIKQYENEWSEKHKNGK